MPDDLADDLQSLSFGSSGRSAATTDTTTTTASSSSSGSAPTSGPISAPGAGGGHGNGHSSSASSSCSCCCCSDPDLLQRQSAAASPAVRMSDLRFLRRLGSGDIGTVYLAQLVPSNSSTTGIPCLRCGGITAKPKQDDQRPQPRLLAAKVMDKEELLGRNKQGRAKAELEILRMLDHPFLPKLVASVQDDRWACLLTDFCPGGDLHVLRQRQPHKRFPEAAVRFYAAEVVVALEYLHMLGVVYRDLKPENVLVRADGHIMLTDFDLSLRCDESASTPRLLGLSSSEECAPGLLPNGAVLPPQPCSGGSGGGGLSASCILPSCIVPAVSCFNSPNGYKSRTKKKAKTTAAATSFSTKNNKKAKKGCYHSSGADVLEFVAEPVGARSMSFVGTHEYLAPEIVSGEGHGSAVDWWTLGVLLFELLYGYTPFRGPDNDMTLANIVARALEFPKDSAGGGGAGGSRADRKAARVLDGGEYCGPPVVSQQVKDLIGGLLVKDPARRLGAATGAAAVKRHPFFHGVNWALLRCAKPPLVPPPLPKSLFVVDHTAGSGPMGMMVKDDGGSCDEEDNDDNEGHTSSSGGSMINRCSSGGGRVSNNDAVTNSCKGSSVGVVVLAADPAATVDGNSPPGSPVDYY